jgi:hypothetical protein
MQIVLLLTENKDAEKVMELPRNWQTLHEEINKRAAEARVGAATKRLLNHMLPLPRTLLALFQTFTKAINPYVADYKVVWGLMDLNIKVR